MQTTLRRYILILTFCLWHLVSNAAVQNSNQETKPILLVMEAGRGKFSNEKGKVFLNFTNPQPQTLWFYDRPFRGTGYMSTQDVVKNWNKMFKSSAPNTVVTYSTELYRYNKKNRDLVKETHLFQNIVLEFKNPKITNGILQFEVIPVGDDAKQAIKDNKALLGPAMFVDNAAGTIDVGGTVVVGGMAAVIKKANSANGSDGVNVVAENQR